MKLTKFRVLNFRSIIDSTWIDCGNVTNIIGVNEAGKSNALLALWKLNPARDGEINLLDDLPRNKYSEWKDNCADKPFIQAYFQIEEDTELINALSEITKHDKDELGELYLERYYDRSYAYHFPNERKITELPSEDILQFVNKKRTDISGISISTKKESVYKTSIINALDLILRQLTQNASLNSNDINNLKEIFCIKETPSAESTIFPLVQEVSARLEEASYKLSIPPINIDDDKIWDLIYKHLPSFVYYSNYGNLDSEIYLPHVIDNLNRSDITGVAAAKARTLRVLFEFINLDPQEILELGTDDQYLNEQQIDELAKKKEERTVLLNSASAKLTQEFRQWWKQGNYIFDLRADGKFFKIWVSDDIRPEKIALESRSTGLQWFLSFYLIFLVETQNALKNSILLLDEAGLSLHPLAQKDLLNFFKSLSKKNQIIHTTHSPFLVDTDNIDDVKLAYVDSDGHTVLSNNLRANTNPKKDTSIYAVYAALGLSISDILLQGCTPIIVEGPSDQYYFYAIKNYLISTGKWHPRKEFVFMPAGGVKGVSAITSIISSNGELPFVILDSDNSGNSFKSKLLKELYREEPQKILSIGDFINKEMAEVEDIIPIQYLNKAIDRIFRDIDDFDFEGIYQSEKPIIPQIEECAQTHNISLPTGYKVEIAKLAKKKLSNLQEEPQFMKIWLDLFNKIQ